MKHALCTFVFGTALALAGVAHAGGSDTDKINGDIHVASGQAAEDVSTINGDIHIDRGARVDDADTVNGSIDMGVKAHAEALETVNGSIRVGDGGTVAKSIEAVNGDIQLSAGADVSGHVENVNGDIRLDAAHVGGGIETVAGNITIGANARVEGGILVDKPDHGWFHFGNDRHTPRIVIGPDAVVTGTLEFRREVELFVSDRAKVGPIKGTTAQTFHGDQP